MHSRRSRQASNGRIPAVNIMELMEPTVGRLLRVTQHQNGTDGQDGRMQDRDL